MKFNIVRPGGGDHSGMFLEMAELLNFSFQELGFESAISVAEAKSGFQNIVIGIFYEGNLWDTLPEDSVIINTEPLFARESTASWSEQLIGLSTKYQIWDYDPRNLQVMAELGLKDSKLLKFGYQKELQRIPFYPDSERHIDVFFYGSTNTRRSEILDQISARGLSCLKRFGVYGEERDELISRSKMIVNMHFNEIGVFEIVRIHYLLNNGIAIVPEIDSHTSIDPSYLDLLSAVPYSGLVDRCVWLKDNPDELLNLRENALTNFKKTPQVVYTQDLIKEFRF